MAFILEQFRIADFIGWHHSKSLVLNPHFQRRNVWTASARSYLIDTILRGHPIPKVYLRTKVDVATRKTVREVVDGQQRLRAILDFADDHLRLSKRAKEFAGLRYSTLGSELQQAFLEYPISVDQLLNASDNDVLEVFARLNAYGLPLNAAERRHAEFQGEFKWAVREAALRWERLWDLGILSTRERLRMLDDSLIAEMFGVLLEGVRDGGQRKITPLYRRWDKSGAFDPEGPVPRNADRTLEYFERNLAGDLQQLPIVRAPHFLMLFAALAHALVGIPKGDMGDDMPAREEGYLADPEAARENLLTLAAVLDSPQSANWPGLEAFWGASRASTQTIKSRQKRFPIYCLALLASKSR